MSSIWTPAPSSEARSSFDEKQSPSQSTTPSNVTATPSTVSPPQNTSALHQRKDDHAHRKRNRIVVRFLPRLDQ